MTLPVAILAGGLATRLHPITERIPKALVDVAGRPFAEHQIELLASQGLTDITFLVSHLGEMVRDALGDGSRWGVRLRYRFDGPQRLGTGGAIRAAIPELGDTFFVLYGDSYLECDYQAIGRAFLAGGTLGLMTVCRNDNRWDRSNVLFTNGAIVAYDKAGRTPGMQHIDYGLGAFHARAFAGRAAHEAFDLADVYRQLLAGGDLASVEVPGRFYEIGSPAGLEDTRAHLAQRTDQSVRAVFLDRDGVINRAIVRDGKAFAPLEERDFEILPGVPQALARLHAAGFRLVVVTNQPEIARGLLSRDVLQRMHARMRAELPIDDIRVCEHDDDTCACRKPRPGMLLDAARDSGIALTRSFMVGDRWKDVEAGRRAGCTTVFIDYGYAEPRPEHPDAIVQSLPEAADWILARDIST